MNDEWCGQEVVKPRKRLEIANRIIQKQMHAFIMLMFNRVMFLWPYQTAILTSACI